MADNKSGIPGVIKFAFVEFKENAVTKKWSAKCNSCSTLITETKGVTSGFTK
jgi:hypothetical protein